MSTNDVLCLSVNPFVSLSCRQKAFLLLADSNLSLLPGHFSLVPPCKSILSHFKVGLQSLTSKLHMQFSLFGYLPSLHTLLSMVYEEPGVKTFDDPHGSPPSRLQFWPRDCPTSKNNDKRIIFGVYARLSSLRLPC